MMIIAYYLSKSFLPLSISLLWPLLVLLFAAGCQSPSSKISSTIFNNSSKGGAITLNKANAIANPRIAPAANSRPLPPASILLSGENHDPPPPPATNTLLS